MSILIHNAALLLTRDGIKTNHDVVIEGSRIVHLRPSVPASRSDSTTPPTEGPAPSADRRATEANTVTVIDGRDRAVVAGWKNGHTHAAMTLLRGYGDDMRLHPWLRERIWPAEANLKPEDLYWGTRLGALEMIKGGTTFANDMYFNLPEVWRAFSDSGIRAAVGAAMFDFGDEGRRTAVMKETDELLDRFLTDPATAGSPRVFLTLAPHSIYTCTGELLQWAARRAEETGMAFHIHMAETEQEVSDCIDAHGRRPFEWLADLGVLERVGPRSVAAHGIWLNDNERRLVSDAGMTIVHNPASNMKLCSGAMDWQALREADVPLMLAPDGVASNNCLDMFDEMKLAALLQKHHTGDPTRLSASEAVALAAGEYSTAFAPFGVGGHLVEGGPADVSLLRLDVPEMTPIHHLESNLAYAANGSVVDTVIVAGSVVMENRQVEGEAEVLREAARCAAALARRAGGNTE